MIVEKFKKHIDYIMRERFTSCDLKGAFSDTLDWLRICYTVGLFNELEYGTLAKYAGEVYHAHNNSLVRVILSNS